MNPKTITRDNRRALNEQDALWITVSAVARKLRLYLADEN